MGIGQQCAKYPTIHKISLYNKELSCQNVNSVDKLLVKPSSLSSSDICFASTCSGRLVMLGNCSSHNIVVIPGPWANQELLSRFCCISFQALSYVQSFYGKLTSWLSVHLQEEKSLRANISWLQGGLAPCLFNKERVLDWYGWESEGTWGSESGHRLNKAQVTLLKPKPQQTWPQIFFLSPNWLWFPLIFFLCFHFHREI